MGANSQKAFTSNKLKKMSASGSNGNIGQRDRDSRAMADDYGRAAAKSSDASAFAFGGAAKKPSLGRAGRASGGKVRDINKVTDGGPLTYGDDIKLRAAGGRTNLAKGGRAKGKTVVNVIVGGQDKDRTPAPPPMAAPGPVLPPMPPPQPRPQMPPAAAGGAGALGAPPMAAPPGAPMGAAGAPPGGPIPPGLIPGRASGGRISQRYGSGSGLGRLANTKRENSGKVKLAE